jgi:hypothetical protein
MTDYISEPISLHTAMRTSNLIQELFSLLIGGAMGKVMIMNVISFGCLASMSLYVSLSMDSKDIRTKKMAMPTVAAIGFLHLYSLCNAASNVTSSVRLLA